MRKPAAGNVNTQSDERTPLTLITKHTSLSYDSHVSVQKEKSHSKLQLSNGNLCLFTYQQWNMYLSRTILYPYASVYANNYDMTLSTFSFIMSAFDVGGCIAVLVTILPSFNRIPIHVCMSIMLLANSFANLSMTFCNSVITLFIVRFATGIFSTIGSSQIRGTIGVTLKDQNTVTQSKLTFGIMLIESAWSSATLGWTFIGIAMTQLSVNASWYIIALTTFTAALLCFCLPRFSIYQVMMNRKPKQVMKPSASHLSLSSLNHLNVTFERHWIWQFKNDVKIQILYLGMFLNGIPFYCFFSTFGSFIQTTFDLNAEQLGYITICVTAGEVSALVFSSYVSKFKSNVFIVILGSCLGLSVFSSFIILIKFELLSLVSSMVILYLFTFTIELSYLNSIVCTLHFSPVGLEATAALIGQFVSRCSSVLSVIMGVHIVEWVGFVTLMEILIACQVISIFIFWWLHKVYWIQQREKEKLNNLKLPVS